MDSALNNLQGLICHKTKQPNNQPNFRFLSSYVIIKMCAHGKLNSLK